MAAAQNPSVHLEAMEETEDKTPKSETIEGACEACNNGGV